eukprot:CAMPEP_0117857318 /NCGR_PEP_ID=MMETSP0950-20121206/1815_1 /TAXON_ID=44440 /ORGANISM="Chattonella subsalsa, Strain CCMP2191" /LENGTH=1189 /DNA_ID=CAMNT_0005706675 /DNA_START=226 /DNA_END=3795 /DNA_ORIENTATION=-
MPLKIGEGKTSVEEVRRSSTIPISDTSSSDGSLGDSSSSSSVSVEDQEDLPGWYQIIGELGCGINKTPDLDPVDMEILKRGTYVKVAPPDPEFANHQLIKNGRRVHVIKPIDGYASLEEVKLKKKDVTEGWYLVVGSLGCAVHPTPDVVEDPAEGEVLREGEMVRVGRVDPEHEDHPLILSGRRVRLMEPVEGYASICSQKGYMILKHVPDYVPTPPSTADSKEKHVTFTVDDEAESDDFKEDPSDPKPLDNRTSTPYPQVQYQRKGSTNSLSSDKTDASAIRDRLAEAVEERNRLAEELSKLRAEAVEANNAQESLKKKADHVAQRAIDATIQMEKSRQEIQRLQSLQQELMAEIEAKWKEKMSMETQPLTEELGTLQQSIVVKDQKLGEVENTLEDLEGKLQIKDSELLKEKQRNEEYIRNQQQLSSEMEQLQSELASTRTLLDQKTNELEGNKKSIEDMQTSVYRQENEMKLILEKQQEREAKLQAELAALMANFEEVIEESAQAKEIEEQLFIVKEDAERTRKEAEECRNEASLAQEAVSKMTEEMNKEREMREEAEFRINQEQQERNAAHAQRMAQYNAHVEEIQMLTEKQNEDQQRMENTLNEMRTHHCQMQNEIRDKEEQVLKMQNEIATLREIADANHISKAQLDEIVKVSGENIVLKARLAKLEEERSKPKVNEVNCDSFKDHQIAELQATVLDLQKKRRQMHNALQELRGNIRVYVRIRPFLPDEQPEDFEVLQPKADGATLAIQNHNHGTPTEFQFNKIFRPHISQDAVFEEVSDFVQSALDGYDVCLFSYGQTSSGKTYTMQGVGNGNCRGIIPRAMEQVGMSLGELLTQGWEYNIHVSFLEIYNEAVRDLLWPLDPNPQQAKNRRNEIKKAKGETFVSGLTKVGLDPTNLSQIESIMEIAARHRSVGSTAMNADSSRSHSVFTMYLQARNEREGRQLNGKLNLVDLAGSERVNKSEAKGDRLKEAVNINQSLSTLSSVFLALGNKKRPIVPYRDSKLTYLLEPALSGDGKTMMILNLCPTKQHYSESLSALKFGSNVNKCELGKAKQNCHELTRPNSRESSSSSQNGKVETGASQSNSASARRLSKSSSFNGDLKPQPPTGTSPRKSSSFSGDLKPQPPAGATPRRRNSAGAVNKGPSPRQGSETLHQSGNSNCKGSRRGKSDRQSTLPTIPSATS